MKISVAPAHPSPRELEEKVKHTRENPPPLFNATSNAPLPRDQVFLRADFLVPSRPGEATPSPRGDRTSLFLFLPPVAVPSFFPPVVFEVGAESCALTSLAGDPSVN
jgi:hypothetical protein